MSFEPQEKIVHYVPDFEKRRYGKITTYLTACKRWFLKQWTVGADALEHVNCPECKEFLSGGRHE